MSKRKSEGYHNNYVTGKTTKIIKEKEDQGIRAFVKAELVNANTGEVEEEIYVENVRKEHLKFLCNSVQYAYNSTSNETFLGNFYDTSQPDAMPQLVLMYDPTLTETELFNHDEGEVVGWADLQTDYGGPDLIRGNRNLPLSGVTLDSTTSEIVHVASVIFDETRIVGKAINKIGLTTTDTRLKQSIYTSKPGSTSVDIRNTGTSHRLLSSGYMDGRELRFINNVLHDDYMDGSSEQDYWQYSLYSKCTGHILSMIDPNVSNTTFTLRIVDISIVPDNYIHTNTSESFSEMSFGPLDDVLSITPSSTYVLSVDTNKAYYCKLIHDQFTIRTFTMSSLTGTLPIEDTTVITFTRPIDVGTPLTVLDYGTSKDVIYSSNGHPVRLELSNSNVVTNELYADNISVIVHDAVKTSDGMYLIVANKSQYFATRGSTNVNSSTDETMSGGYLDFTNSRFIETFGIGAPGGMTSSLSKSNTRTTPQVVGLNDQFKAENKVVFFCNKTGRIFHGNESDDSNLITTMAIFIPIPYIPPSPYAHIDVIPEIIKTDTQQLRISYEIRTPSDISTYDNPFDTIYNPDNGMHLAKAGHRSQKWIDTDYYNVDWISKIDTEISDIPKFDGAHQLVEKTIFAGFNKYVIGFEEDDGAGGRQFKLIIGSDNNTTISGLYTTEYIFPMVSDTEIIPYDITYSYKIEEEEYKNSSMTSTPSFTQNNSPETNSRVFYGHLNNSAIRFLVVPKRYPSSSTNGGTRATYFSIETLPYLDLKLVGIRHLKYFLPAVPDELVTNGVSTGSGEENGLIEMYLILNEGVWSMNIRYKDNGIGNVVDHVYVLPNEWPVGYQPMIEFTPGTVTNITRNHTNMYSTSKFGEIYGVGIGTFTVNIQAAVTYNSTYSQDDYRVTSPGKNTAENIFSFEVTLN